jgi:O-acetyl-ADP-ribose deacetylase (regulator of RNase III)
LAELNTLRSLAFPAISSGVYGYPWDEAASIAVGVVRERSWELDEVCFTLFSESALKEYNKVLFGY